MARSLANSLSTLNFFLIDGFGFRVSGFGLDVGPHLNRNVSILKVFRAGISVSARRYEYLLGLLLGELLLDFELLLDHPIQLLLQPLHLFGGFGFRAEWPYSGRRVFIN